MVKFHCLTDAHTAMTDHTGGHFKPQSAPLINQPCLKKRYQSSSAKLCDLDAIYQKNIQVIDATPIIPNPKTSFNQLILGDHLAPLNHWRSLLSIKMKYLFSTQVRQTLTQAFQQAENLFYHRQSKPLSSGTSVLISCMQTFATWDKDVSILVVDQCVKLLDNRVRQAFLQCLHQLSTHVFVLITTDEPISIDGIEGNYLKTVH